MSEHDLSELNSDAAREELSRREYDEAQPPLLAQLKPGGRMEIPTGIPEKQALTLVEPVAKDHPLGKGSQAAMEAIRAAIPPALEGDRWYGRGTADNKGQHSINLAALGAVIQARDGKLGFNAKVLVEMAEETGSPGLATLTDKARSMSASPDRAAGATIPADDNAGAAPVQADRRVDQQLVRAGGTGRDDGGGTGTAGTWVGDLS